MVLWGGLRPIFSRVVLDALALTGLSIASLTSCEHKMFNSVTILVSCVIITLTSAGLTNRWTVTFPMVPILILQGLRRIPVISARPAIGTTIAVLSMVLIFLSAALCVLFPAVELPPINGTYNVGVVDFFLPVHDEQLSSFNAEESKVNDDTCNSSPSLLPSHHVSVRLLYPTFDEPETIPYLHPETATEFCRESMRFGAPGPLKKFDWFLHHWRLIGLRAKRRARLIPGKSKIPLVVFSHGLGGDAALYSYQTMSLASQGNLVLSVNHQDGSSPVVRTYNGSSTTFDFSLAKLWQEGKHVEYVRSRRERTSLRSKELLAATEVLLKLNTDDDRLDASVPGISLHGRISTDEVTFIGHSFGGATVLTAAMRRPDMVKSVIAHDPAADWMPDDSRRSLFNNDVLEGLNCTWKEGTGGFKDEKNDETTTEDHSLHDTDMLLMFSQQWRDQEWAQSHIFEELHRAGKLGRQDGFSDYRVIKGSNHNEFSDTCMLTPTWLARKVGVTGERKPSDTAKEIEEITRSYLQKRTKMTR